MLKAEHGISGMIKHISFNRFTLPLVFKILFVNPCAVDTQINRIGKYNNNKKRSYRLSYAPGVIPQSLKSLALQVMVLRPSLCIRPSESATQI